MPRPTPRLPPRRSSRTLRANATVLAVHALALVALEVWFGTRPDTLIGAAAVVFVLPFAAVGVVVGFLAAAAYNSVDQDQWGVPAGLIGSVVGIVVAVAVATVVYLTYLSPDVPPPSPG